MSDWIPAAEYIRGSKSEQFHSIEAQQSVIRSFAERHGMQVVRTYSDIGKSGLIFRKRQGFASLIDDVLSGNAPFKRILVQDVSRWGRFQDVDESAHLEFLCRRAGIPVMYCAEAFLGDEVTEPLLKAVCRFLAAEYSRDLSVKCFEVAKQIVENGFSAGANAPYGLWRVAVSQDNRIRAVLKFGERKRVVTDRVTFIHGPKDEVQCVRNIFRLFLRQHLNPSAISTELNRRGIPSPRGVRWTGTQIYQMLCNPKYMGCNVWNRRAVKLKGPVVKLPPSKWVVVPHAFPPIISPAMFAEVQRKLRVPEPHRSDERLLQDLRCLLARHGKITAELIRNTPQMVRSNAYMHRFGSLLAAYKRIGYEPTRPYPRDKISEVPR